MVERKGVAQTERARAVNMVASFDFIVDECGVPRVDHAASNRGVNPGNDHHHGQGRHREQQFSTKFEVGEQAHSLVASTSPENTGRVSRPPKSHWSFLL